MTATMHATDTINPGELTFDERLALADQRRYYSSQQPESKPAMVSAEYLDLTRQLSDANRKYETAMAGLQPQIDELQSQAAPLREQLADIEARLAPLTEQLSAERDSWSINRAHLHREIERLAPMYWKDARKRVSAHVHTPAGAAAHNALMHALYTAGGDLPKRVDSILAELS